MKKTLTIVALALLVSGAAAARRTEPGGGFGGFGPSVAFTSFASLNEALAEHGLPALSSRQWMLGGGGYAHIGRVVIGGCGWGGSQSVSSEDRLVRVELGGGQFEAGYALFVSPHLVVAPVLGIGGSGYGIVVESREYPGNFGEFLTEPGPSSQVGFSGFTLVPELMVTVPVSFFGVQLKAGYLFRPVAPDWRFPNGGALHQGPDLGKGEPFATLNVVFGSLGRRKTGK